MKKNGEKLETWQNMEEKNSRIEKTWKKGKGWKKLFSCCMTDSLPANQGLSFNTKKPSCGFSMIGHEVQLTTFMPCYLLYCIAHTLHVCWHMCVFECPFTVTVYICACEHAEKRAMRLKPLNLSSPGWLIHDKTHGKRPKCMRNIHINKSIDALQVTWVFNCLSKLKLWHVNRKNNQ